MDISVDHSRVPPGTLHVSVYFAGGDASSTPIATPEILAGHAPAATQALRLTGSPIVELARDAFGLRAPVIGSPMYVGVAALDDAFRLYGGWSGPIEDFDHMPISVVLDPDLQPELWGTKGETTCLRIATGSTTAFLTRDDDPDCDGLLGAEDTQPYAFCDPTATSGPAHDACK